ncbi:MAG: S8 family serine peptidase [Acidobacteriota bacterium]|nr:S8 family serine peptidase [Acidobacteriota bacterium]
MTRPVRVVLIDSGVHAAHPHVGGVSGGVGIDSSGDLHDDFVDRLGHGTAVAAVVREKAPAAEILIAKVFDRELAATGPALVAAGEWAIEQRADVVNLSLGTTNAQHEGALAVVVSRLRESGAVIIAAGPQDGVAWLPGRLPGVWSVTLDWSLPREQCRVAVSPAREVSFTASGFPRPIPGVPPEKNLKGLSFAVANVSGLVAALIANEPGTDPVDLLLRAVSTGRMG